MKKILFAIVAVAAMSACTKTEVEYTDQTQIGFSPIASNITKSVAGVGADGTFDNTFPTNLSLFIFANVQDEDENENPISSWTTEYLNNTLFVSNRLENGYYEGKPARYWPNVKSLVFAGYSNPSETKLEATMDFDNNILTINNYIQDNTTTNPGANDLMWFPYNGSQYKKADSVVPASMKHACSWITVQVLGNEVTGSNYLLKELKINDLYHKGNVDCKVVTNTVGGVSTTVYTAEWDQTKLSKKDYEILYSNSSGETFSKDTPIVFENEKNNLVVIPQKPTSIDVKYSYIPQEGVAPVTEIVKGLDLKITEDPSSVDNIWESGKHYIYTISITATEILVSPTVAEWTPVPVN